MAFVTNITSVTSSINSVSNLSRTLDSVFEEAQLTGLLSLSNRNLKEFPTISSRFDLSDTVEADLSKNRFVEFPVHLAEYISLEALHLCNNCIRSIPIAVQHLQSLSYLDLSRNYLRWIPPELCLLPLEVLLLRNNCLSLLPREIYMTSNTLMELDVSCNKLEALPNEIGAMKALRVLNVRENLLKELPTGIIYSLLYYIMIIYYLFMNTFSQNLEDCKYALESRLDRRKSRHHTIAADSGYSTMTEENGKLAETPPSNSIHDISPQDVHIVLPIPHRIADSNHAYLENNSTNSTHSPKTMSQSLYVPLGKNLNGSTAVNTDGHSSQSGSFVNDVISACNERIEARNFDLGRNSTYYQSNVVQNSIISDTIVNNRRLSNKTVRQNGHHYYQNVANYGVIKENTKTSVRTMDVLKDEDEKFMRV
uniref:Uncharacterized protein n=1 Tax=Romanomermis culicivorax TaxID=13658 RepID=A0A915KX18_ROMCU